MKYSSNTWEVVGGTQLSDGSAYYTRLVVDENTGEPYVIYEDGTNSNEATVKRYDTSYSTWKTVGTAGFSDGTVNYTNIAIDNDTLYVAFEDQSGSYDAITCMANNGSAWTAVGSERFTGTTASIDWPYLYVTNDTPYVAYQDTIANSRNAAAYQYNGSSWVKIGTALSDGIASYICLSGSGEVLYLAFSDDDSGPIDRKLRVKKYNGTSWSDVGSANGISTGVALYVSITVADGIPYVAYHDADQDNKCTVQRFVSNTWEVVGEAGFSNGAVGNTSIFVYNSIPYVAYRDASYGPYGDAAVLMRYIE